MLTEYYILGYRLDQIDAFLIWYSDDSDGVMLDKAGNVISFNSIEHILEYAAHNNIVIKTEDSELLNLDHITEWIKTCDPELINFSEFNNTWNLWTDIANSTGYNFDQDRDTTDKIYHKLFWGCNLPVVTPEGKEYIPEWTDIELKVMKELFLSGTAMFREVVKSYKSK
jgi:predicted transglutaminase-like protease